MELIRVLLARSIPESLPPLPFTNYVRMYVEIRKEKQEGDHIQH